MNLMKKVSMMAAAAALAVSLAACSSVPANTVHSMDDLPGKKIGVQLGLWATAAPAIMRAKAPQWSATARPATPCRR